MVCMCGWHQGRDTWPHTWEAGTFVTDYLSESLFWIFIQNRKTLIWREIDASLHSIIYNSQDLEMTKVAIDEWIKMWDWHTMANDSATEKGTVVMQDMD